MVEFYRRTDVVTHSTTFLDTSVLVNYPDVFDGQTGTATIKGNVKGNRYILNAPISTAPTFGDTILSGLKMNLWATDVTAINSFSTPEYEIYKIKNNIGNEGSVTIQTKDIACFSHNAGDSVSIISEDFSGIKASEDTTELVGSTRVLFSEPFLYLDDAIATTWAKSHRNRDEFVQKKDGEYRYATLLDDGTLIIPIRKFYLTLGDDNDYQEWIVAKGKDPLDLWEPTWEWKDIKDVIKYKHTTTLEDKAISGGASEDIIISESSIFNKLIYSEEKDTGGSSGGTGDPLLRGKATGSSSKSTVGGQSMRMNCFWEKDEIYDFYGQSEASPAWGSGFAQAQTVATSTQIPCPVPTDCSILGAKQKVRTGNSTSMQLTPSRFGVGEYFTLYVPNGLGVRDYWKYVFWSRQLDDQGIPEGSEPDVPGTKDYIQITNDSEHSINQFCDAFAASINSATYTNTGFNPFTATSLPAGSSSTYVEVECNEIGECYAPSGSMGNAVDSTFTSGTTSFDWIMKVQGKDWWTAVNSEISFDVFFAKLADAHSPSSADISDSANEETDFEQSNLTWWNNTTSQRSFAVTMSMVPPDTKDDFPGFIHRKAVKGYKHPFFGFYAIKVTSKSENWDNTATYNQHIRIVPHQLWTMTNSYVDGHYYAGYSAKRPEGNDGALDTDLSLGKWYKFRFLINGHQDGSGRRQRYSQTGETNQYTDFISLIIEESDGKFVSEIRLANKVQASYRNNSTKWGLNAGGGTDTHWGDFKPSWPSWFTLWLNNTRGEGELSSSQVQSGGADFDSESIVYIDNFKVKDFGSQKRNFSITDYSRNINHCHIKENKVQGMDIEGNNMVLVESTYETHKNTVPTYLSFGFESASDLEGAERWLWLNNFEIANNTNDNPIIPTSTDSDTTPIWIGGHAGPGDVGGGVRASYSNGLYSSGCLMERSNFQPSSSIYSSGDTYRHTGTGRGLIVDNNSNAELIINSGALGTPLANSVDGFITKGFLKLHFDDIGTANPPETAQAWRPPMDKRESILCSTHIKSIEDWGASTGEAEIEVYESNVFNLDDNTVYRAYLFGMDPDGTWNPTVGTGTAQVSTVVITANNYTSLEQGEYFIIYTEDNSKIGVAAWVDDGDAATISPPAPPTDSTVESWIQFEKLTDKDVTGDKLAAAINSHTSFTSTASTGTVTITNTNITLEGDVEEDEETPKDLYDIIKPTSENKSITAVQSYHATVSGTIAVTAVAHGLLSGDVITISGTTDYNGTFAITKIDADNFYVTETFVDTQTGTISKKSTSFAFAVTTQGVSGTALTPAFKTLVDDIKVVKREGNTITLNKSLASLKDYSAMAVAAGSSWSTSNFDKYDETLMPFILIGPKKYWLTLQIMPKDSDNNLLPTRQYHSALMFSAAPTDTGTTYNEIDFTEANYAKKWDLKPTEKGSALDLSQDYGFGAFKPDEGSGGFVNTFQPFESATPPTGNGRFNLIDLSPVIEANKIEAEDLLTFMISPSNEDTGHELTVATSEYTTNTNYRPNFLTVFTDEMPLPPENFKVLPFEDNPFYPEFTWQAKDKDLWYGFLMIDNENIYNQYHKAVIYYPLNEVGIHNIAATAPVEKISALATTISGPLYDVEGLTGYALNFDGNDDYVECNTGHGNDPTSLCTTEMSVVLHIIPDSASDTRYLISQNIYDENNGDSYGTDKFYLRLNSSNQIEAMVSFSTTEFVSLTSSSILPTDGEIPTNIILTADTTLKSGNVKLFVNGKLEDQSGLSTTAGGTNNWKKNTPIYGGNSVIRFGNHLLYDTAGYDGKMEEIVIYKKCIYPLNPSEGRFLFTKPMEELGTSSIASSKSYTAKLFIKDYHNIRGKINTEVSSSSQISWRKAAFALDTS